MHAVRLALLIALIMAPLAAHAGEQPSAQINCTNAVGIPGGIALVEVTLVRHEAADVVGTQNDLSYDGARFSIERGDCFINPEIGPDSPLDKTLQDNVLADPPRLRGIVVSLGNVDPIPSGLLYSCPFRVADDTPLGTYGIGNGNLVASNAEGNRLPVSGSDCEIEVAEPTVTPTPTPRCRTNDDCPSGQVCVDGECVEATPTATAPNPTATRTATPGCEDNEDCPMGQVCVGNMCVTPTPTPRCREDMDCPSGQVCVEGECVNATPTASPTVTTRRSGGGGGCSCEIDPDAPSTSMSDVLAVLLPALVLLMRWRTRRTPH